MNAIAMLKLFAKPKTPKRRHPSTILNPHLTTAASTPVVASVAMMYVATQVPRLNVPMLKCLYNTCPGNTSHASPSSGIRGIPATVDTEFITMSTTAARFHERPNPPSHNTNHSVRRPAVIGITLISRCSKMSAGQTMSASRFGTDITETSNPEYP